MADTNISPWQLLISSATPVMEVCLLAALGAVLAWKGVLDAKGCGTAAWLSFYVFSPALTFSKLSQAVSLSSIMRLWPLLANMSLSMAIGMGLGFALARLLRAPPAFTPHLLCACAFANVGNLPLVFVWALCRDQHAMFRQVLGDRCEHLGMAYVAFNIAAATVGQFTLAIHMLRPKREPHLVTEQELAAVEAEEQQQQQQDRRKLHKQLTVSDLLEQRRAQQLQEAAATALVQQRARSAALPALQNTVPPAERLRSALELQPLALQPLELPEPLQPRLGSRTGGSQAGSRPATSTIGSNSEDSEGKDQDEDQEALDDRAALLGGRSASGEAEAAAVSLARWAPSGSTGDDARPGLLTAMWGWLQRVDWASTFPLPTQATILGILVGCIPAVKGLLYSPTGDPPLRVVSETLDILGGGFIPIAVPLLGAVLFRGPGQSQLPWRVVLGVLVCRLVLVPLVMTGVLLGCLKLGLFHPPDAMFLLSLLLVNATPTAINMQTITVLYKHGEAEMSTILFWQYLASLVTLPAAMWVFLKIIHAWSA